MIACACARQDYDAELDAELERTKLFNEQGRFNEALLVRPPERPPDYGLHRAPGPDEPFKPVPPLAAAVLTHACGVIVYKQPPGLLYIETDEPSPDEPFCWSCPRCCRALARMHEGMLSPTQTPDGCCEPRVDASPGASDEAPRHLGQCVPSTPGTIALAGLGRRMSCRCMVQ